MRSLEALAIIDGQTRLESCPTKAEWLARATEAAARSPGLPPRQPRRPRSQAVKKPPTGGGGVQRGVSDFDALLAVTIRGILTSVQDEENLFHPSRATQGLGLSCLVDGSGPGPIGGGSWDATRQGGHSRGTRRRQGGSVLMDACR